MSWRNILDHSSAAFYLVGTCELRILNRTHTLGQHCGTMLKIVYSWMKWKLCLNHCFVNVEREQQPLCLSWGRIQELKMFYSVWGLIQWTTLSAALSLSKHRHEHELWCEVRPASMWDATYNHKGSSMSSCMSYHLPSPLSSRLVKVQGDGPLNNAHPN